MNSIPFRLVLVVVVLLEAALVLGPTARPSGQHARARTTSPTPGLPVSRTPLLPASSSRDATPIGRWRLGLFALCLVADGIVVYFLWTLEARRGAA